jgi:hypothetical protein
VSFVDFVRQRDGKTREKPKSKYPRVLWVHDRYSGAARKDQILYLVGGGFVSTCPDNSIPKHTADSGDRFCLYAASYDLVYLDEEE